MLVPANEAAVNVYTEIQNCSSLAVINVYLNKSESRVENMKISSPSVRSDLGLCKSERQFHRCCTVTCML